ncbi:S8 family peptidase [Paenibacillus radicis (ex Xue et al. 2023)]|uniref:S8 family serine peptidase n=1 Tax=Paenibacillus radicis (ex Xue et al. 2023) TaxID=2972489 RepID=A0ABT1YGM1_9BACL|nr:S8 family serine peptidase [Paenibacillus radicis (ex Xue et al. 2023)]MCR8632336.1 S8 family serine peptidase [Paenibacillus radicis (ex Xue et al. 2023)]
MQYKKIIHHFIRYGVAGIIVFMAFLGSIYAKSPTVIAAAADDPFVPKQTYLEQIHVNEAWDVATGNTNITIAIVDTGVDLNHPDLKPNLVSGVNLINPSRPPQDDNGHGTNVAGVVGAVGNNDRGVSGILWKARIMPVKALEADGSGGEAKLGEGIRYAVDHGAKIVVLSLGLNKYSNYMNDVVQYAEEKDVLLVAATGNEGNRVKYPAAYPTVLAVGGMTTGNTADSRSNTGPEIDLVAPWDVFTTARGGSYEYKDGTSMAAPQVAAVAALAWSKYPGMKAYQIRQLLRQTADDLEAPGWDSSTGYGLLRADRALKEMPLADMYEPNNRKDQAKSISVSKMISASFTDGADQDWYYFDAPYNGKVNFTFDIPEGQQVAIQHTDAKGTFTSLTAKPGQPATVQVSKGRSYVQLQLANRNFKQEVLYKLTTSFDIYRDQFEDNDRQYSAYVLPSRSQTLKGTFHQIGDQDWFELPIKQSGSLSISLSVDTARIDPVLFVQKQGEKSYTVDEGDDGITESLILPEVFPGSYYIRVSNVKEYQFPVTGEYTLTIDYDVKQIDPNEPNNRSYQATTVSLETAYYGLIDKLDDQDWFQFRVLEDSLVQINLTDIPDDVTMYMYLYDGSMRSMTNTDGWNAVQLQQRLPAGTYYVKLTANQAFDRNLYQFKVNAKPLMGNFTDIRGHWAQASILEMSGNKAIEGYDDYTFRPNQTITRAEATTILSRAFNLTKQKNIAYTDLSPKHWAFVHIARAAQSGIIDGYPDQSFAPDQPVSRMEMISMFARSLNKTGKQRGDVPFTDVDNNYWGVGILKQLKAEGWIGGYADGTFRPDQQATRAEFVTMLAQMTP